MMLVLRLALEATARETHLSVRQDKRMRRRRSEGEERPARRRRKVCILEVECGAD